MLRVLVLFCFVLGLGFGQLSSSGEGEIKGCTEGFHGRDECLNSSDFIRTVRYVQQSLLNNTFLKLYLFIVQVALLTGIILALGRDWRFYLGLGEVVGRRCSPKAPCRQFNR
jgi:hypothetical protein